MTGRRTRALSLFDIRRTDCRWLCWCVPTRDLSGQIDALAKQFPPSRPDRALAEVRCELAAGDSALELAAALDEYQSGGGTRYDVRISARVRGVADSVPREGETDSAKVLAAPFLEFLGATLPIAAAPVSARVCAEFSLDTVRTRPVLQLPVELVSQEDAGGKLSGARIDGLELTFTSKDRSVDRARITMNEDGSRMVVWFRARGRLALGANPLKAAYARALEVLSLLTEEASQQ